MAVSPSKHMRPKDAAQEAPQSETMLPDTVVDVITRVLARLEAMDARARQLQSSVCDVERAVHASNSMLETSIDEQRSWAHALRVLRARPRVLSGPHAAMVMGMHGVPCRPVDPKHYISNQISDSQKNQ